MSGYFSRKKDEPDTEPFRRFYAEGGYVDDTSHDIDDVDAGLYGSQNFAWGGKVGSLFKFVKNLVGTTADPEDAKMFEALRKHTQQTGNEASQLSLGDGILSEMSLGTPVNVPMPRDYVELLSNPNAVGTFAHTHPNNTMVPSAADFNMFAHAHPSFNSTRSFPDNWIIGPDDNAALFVPRLDEQSKQGNLRGGAIASRLFPQYYEAIEKGTTGPMMREIDNFLQPYLKQRREAVNDLWTVEDIDALRNARTKMTAAFPHNELLKGGLDMQVDPGLVVLNPAKGEHAPLTIGQAWPELIDRLDTLGASPIRTQDWLPGYAEGGQVTDEDWGAYVSQYFDEGGQVEPEGYANGGLIRKFLESVTAPLKAWHGTPHNIDKFDAAKIGTGEGAQGYGHGLYFAENPEVAKWYRETLSSEPTWQFKDSIGNVVDKEFLRSQMSRIAGFDGDKTLLDAIEGRVKDFDPQPSHNIDTIINGILAGESPDYYLGRFTRGGYNYDAAVNHLVDNYSVEATKPGNLYEVGLHAPRNTLLSWDEPLSRQPEPVIEALDRFGIKPDIQGLRDYDDALLHNLHAAPGKGRPLPRQPVDPTGAQLYESSKIVPGGYRDPAAASDALLEAGIPGIRYRDGRSRGRGEAGTHNYVMFPGTEDLIEILGRYAEGGQVEEDVAPPRGYFGGC